MAQRAEDELHFSPTKKMVGERNPDSVLFRLDELEATAEGGQTPPLRLSSSVRGGGSGLIDLKELIAAGPEFSSEASEGEGTMAAHSSTGKAEGLLSVGTGGAEASSASGASRTALGAQASTPSGRFTPHAGTSSAASRLTPVAVRQPFWVTALLILGALVAVGAGVLVFMSLR